MPGAPALALDVGGTKLAAALVDGRGAILASDRARTPVGPDAEPLFDGLIGCATAVLREGGARVADLAGVGVACGGPMRWPQGEVSPLNIPAWRGFPLAARLRDALGREVLLHNDGVAIAAGEHWRGAGQGVANLLGVTISTGVGGGLVLGGRLHHGASGNAGHIGHVVVEPAGPPCACGGRGCLEAVASGPSTVARALAEGWMAAGGRADGVALAKAAEGGDPTALRNIARAGRGLGVALASCAALLDLELVVVVGGFSLSGPAFWDAVDEAFAAHAGLEFARRCRVGPGGLGGDAGLVGAAAFIHARDRYGWDTV